MPDPNRELRLVVIMNMAILALAWVAFVLRPIDISAQDVIVGVAFAVASLLTIRVVPAVVRGFLPPLPRDTSEADARRLSLERFRPAVAMGTVATLVVPYLSAIVGINANSPLAFLVPFVVGEFLLYRFLRPHPGIVEVARQRLEAEGARSQLAEALAKQR